MIALRPALSIRDRRTLTLGMGSTAVLIALFLSVPAWQAWRAEKVSVATESIARAAELDDLLSTFDQAMDTLTARTARLRGTGPRLVSGATPAEAGSNLTAFLSQLARESLVRIDAVEIHLDSTRTRSFPHITVQLQATSDISGLSALVLGLERGPTLISVRQLSVRPQNPDVTADGIETLSLRMTLEAAGIVLPKTGS